MEQKQKEGFTPGKAVLTGLTAGGIIALIGWLISQAKEVPEGAVIFTPDQWTKETLIGILTALAGISGKLDAEIAVLNDIKALLGGEPTVPTFSFEVTPIPATVVFGLTPKVLYQSEAPHSGSVIAIELVSDCKDIEYELHLDDIVWTFNVSDMVDSSIEYPHFPGAWIAKATGATFVFMFSSGAVMDVRYKTNFRLVAKATSATDVNLTRGDLVRKVYELG